MPKRKEKLTQIDLILFTKINPKWIINQNVKGKTEKNSEKNRKSCDEFLYTAPNGQPNWEKNQLVFIKIKNFSVEDDFKE